MPPLLESLQRYLADGSRLSASEIVAGIGAGTQESRGIVIPVGVNAEGGTVAAACTRPDFPDESDELLLFVAANQAATAFRIAGLIDDHLRAVAALRDSERQLETKMAEDRRIAPHRRTCLNARFSTRSVITAVTTPRSRGMALSRCRIFRRHHSRRRGGSEEEALGPHAAAGSHRGAGE
jgi:hypothetical protein